MSTHNAQFVKKYDLGTIKGVYAIFKNIHILRNSRLTRSDFNASVILMDFESALRRTKLTGKQKKALYLVYERDLTQREASKIMNCTQQAVQQHIKASVMKIACTYSKGGNDNRKQV